MTGQTNTRNARCDAAVTISSRVLRTGRLQRRASLSRQCLICQNKANCSESVIYREYSLRAETAKSREAGTISKASKARRKGRQAPTGRDIVSKCQNPTAWKGRTLRWRLRSALPTLLHLPEVPDVLCRNPLRGSGTGSTQY